MIQGFLIACIFAWCMWYCTWQSPFALNWVIAHAAARLDALQAHRKGFKQYKSEMDERVEAWQK